MKMRLFWLPCLMLLFGALCVSCGSDNNEPTDEPGAGGKEEIGGTEVKGDYTATTAVKTVMLKNEWRWDSVDIPACYEDFNRKYGMSLCFGDLVILPYIRKAGEWIQEIKVYSTGLSYDDFYVIMEDVGKVNNLSEVIKKIEPTTSIGSKIVYPDAQPKHGYAVTFRTEDDELKYLRIFVADYTLNDFGTVSTVTIQYQLY